MLLKYIIYAQNIAWQQPTSNSHPVSQDFRQSRVENAFSVVHSVWGISWEDLNNWNILKWLETEINWRLVFLYSVLFWLLVLGIRPKATYMLSKYPTTALKTSSLTLSLTLGPAWPKAKLHWDRWLEYLRPELLMAWHLGFQRVCRMQEFQEN